MSEYPTPKLSPEEIVEENKDLADRAPDSTRDNGPRPPAWNPPIVSKEDHKDENPYNR